MERETGFEPATSTLARSHSTTELLPLRSLLDYISTGDREQVTGYRERRGRHLRNRFCNLFPVTCGLAFRPLWIFGGAYDVSIAHVNDAVANVGRSRVVSDHQHGLAEFLIGLPQHVQHDV